MAGRTFVDPELGLQVVVQTSAAESRGALLRVEYLTTKAGPPAEDHVHAQEQERVEVLTGAVHCRIDGRERLLGPGDVVVVPPGTPHAFWAGDAPESRAIGEFRPAGTMEQTLATLFREERAA